MEERQLQVGVKILLRNKNGKYLLLHRSKEKYPDMVKNPWDIAGGRINPGTPLLENLKREIMEETGLNFDGDATLLAAQDILRNPERHVVRLTYTGEIDGEPQLDSEHDSYKWFTLEELKNLKELDDYIREVLAKLENKF